MEGVDDAGFVRVRKDVVALVFVILVFVGVLGFVFFDLSNDDSSDESGEEDIVQEEGQQSVGGMPPTESIAACEDKVIGDVCEFLDSSGVCDDKPGVLACAPSRDGEASQDSESVAITGETTDVDSSTYESCIGNTADNPECKNCCDCLDDADGKVRTACRDECAVHDFSGNSDFITFDVPSVLGESGDYSECSSLSGEQECKGCCEDSMGLQCGDYRHCRTACNEAFG